MLALSTNALEIWGIPPPTKTKESPPEANRVYSVDIPGHRSDVRSLCLSSDDRILASAANGESCMTLYPPAKTKITPGSLKLWNMKTTACIRTMECGPVVCSTFLPGDRHVRKDFGIIVRQFDKASTVSSWYQVGRNYDL